MEGPEEQRRPLRVLHVLCDCSGGGAERLVLDLCRHCGPGVRPSVAAVHDGGALLRAFQDAGVDVQSVGRRRGSPGIAALGRLVRLARRADVVHTHLWAGDTWGRTAARLARCPIVVSTEHNTAGDGLWRERVGRLTAGWTTTVVAVSDAAASYARRQGARRVSVIPNGVELSRFPASPLPEGPPWRLAVVGRLTRQKGVDVLIRALLDHVDLPWELDVVGEGEDLAHLQSLAAASHRPIRFVGWVADPSELYAAAHVVVVPSRWEGFGLVAVEALSAGRPVVASAVDALVDVVGQAGVLVPPADPAALGLALTDLLGDPVELRRLAEGGPGHVRRFDIRSTVDQYEALYRALADRGTDG